METGGCPFICPSVLPAWDSLKVGQCVGLSLAPASGKGPALADHPQCLFIDGMNGRREIACPRSQSEKKGGSET